MSPKNIAKVIAQMREDKNPSAFNQINPYSEYLGLNFFYDSEGPYTKLFFSDFLIGNPTIPALHGGVIAGLMENAAIFHILWQTKTYMLPVTIDMSFDFLRPGQPDEVLAKGSLIRCGKKIVNISVQAWQENPNKPIANARGNFLFRREES